MTDNSLKPRLLGISGSLRKGSFNTAILASLGASVEERASLRILPLNDLPPTIRMLIPPPRRRRWPACVPPSARRTEL